MKKALRFSLLGASFVLVSQACGSSDEKKKSPGPEYTSGGEGGEAASTGGTARGGRPTAGNGGVAGTVANGAGQPTADGGSAAGNGSAVTDAGAAGQAGASSGCPTGYGECDGDPATVCEQSLSVVTACGDCTTQCVASHGSAQCTDRKCVFSCADGYADCDGKPENGCEAQLTTDAANCGSCGHSCAAKGATCSSSLCSILPLQQGLPIGNDNSGARAWAFSSLGIISNGFNFYTLRRLPLDGQAPLTIWTSATKTSPTEGLVVVDSDVYWSERGDPSKKFSSVVYKKALTASAATPPTAVFTPELAATFLRRQGNALYWASGGYQEEGNLAGGGGFIYTRALNALDTDAGTKLVTVDQGNWSDIKDLGVTTDALYWVTDQNTGTPYELRTAPLAGTPISVVPAVFANASLAVSNAQANNGFDPVSLIAAGDYIYFNREANDAQDGVYRYKTGLAKPERLVIADDVISLGVDATYVYFIQRNVAALWRAPINNGAGGLAEKLAVLSGSLNRIVGVDATFVYVAAVSSGSSDFFKVIK